MSQVETCRRDIARRIQKTTRPFSQAKTTKFSSAKFTATEPSSFFTAIFFQGIARLCPAFCSDKSFPRATDQSSRQASHIFSKSSMLTAHSSAHSLASSISPASLWKHFTPLIFKRGVASLPREFIDNLSISFTGFFANAASSFHCEIAYNSFPLNCVPKSPK